MRHTGLQPRSISLSRIRAANFRRWPSSIGSTPNPEDSKRPWQSKIPCLVIGSERFYEREEVHNLVELLRAVNSYDLERLAPPLAWLFRIKEARIPHYFQIKGGRLLLRARDGLLAPKRLEECLDALARIGARPKEFSPAQVLELILEQSGYYKRLKRQRTPSALQCLANIEELLQAARKFGSGELDFFSDHVALLENLELVDWGRNAVKLLTVHSAKGLEFPVVFLAGLIEGVFPLTKSLAETRALEEERRLCFVAATRAQEELYLSYPKRRYQRPTEPSRFIPEMLGM
jgi:DNA helicase-2/ATP-dependent DNA helicase PcrA